MASGASPELENGNPQAGVVFQRSSMVGLLLV